MLDAVRGNSFVLLIVVATLYSGELVWRERDTHFDGIHDALPMRESTDWLSKLSALAVIELILLTVVTALRHPQPDLRRLLPLRAPPILQRALHRHLPASPHLHPPRPLPPDRPQEQVHRPRHRHRQLRSARRSPGPRLGKHPLPLRQHPQLHLLGHERLRPLRPRALLVHHLLALHRGPPRRHLHRPRCPRHRRRLRLAPAPLPPSRPAPRPRRRSLHPHRHRQRRLVLLQLPRPQRIPQRSPTARHPGPVRARLQEVSIPPATQDHRRRRQHRHLPRAPLLLRHRPLRPPEQNPQPHLADPHRRHRSSPSPTSSSTAPSTKSPPPSAISTPSTRSISRSLPAKK